MVQGFASKTNLTSISLPSDSAPIGSIQSYPGANAPAGWLLCDGSAISRTTYASLFAITGTMYGVGDGSTTFNIPDLRGIFVRGAGTSSKLTMSVGTACSGTLGAYQNDKIQGHKTRIELISASSAAGTNVVRTGDLSGGSSAKDSYIVTDGINGTPRTGAETNPANLSLTYIIKASQVLTDVIIAQNTVLHPVGMVAMFGGSIAPYGWSMCDGSALSRTEYADLYATIGTTYGVGDGSTTFNLPDCRGIFIRGAGTSGKLTMATGTACSGSLGAYQNDKFQGHWHQNVYKNTATGNSTTPWYNAHTSNSTTDSSASNSIQNAITDNINGIPRIGSETNPANLSLNYIIKSRNVTSNYQSTFPPIITGSAAPTITPQYVGQEYIDTVAKRQYKAFGVSSSSDWQKQSVFYSGTTTITAGGGDVTVTIPWDWTNGILEVHTSNEAGEYFEDSTNNSLYFKTSYIALTSGTYTNYEIVDQRNGAVPVSLDQTFNLAGIPKSATSTTFVLNDDGNTVYCKYFVWA